MVGLGKFFLGDKLGEGAFRKVYEMQFRDDLVIKVAKGYDGIQSNINEWQLWERCEYGDFYKPLREWLAPCLCISFCGKYLVQRRALPIIDRKLLPTVVPACMTDLKMDNVGIYDGRVVFIDYGIHLIVEEAILNNKAKIVSRDYW